MQGVSNYVDLKKKIKLRNPKKEVSCRDISSWVFLSHYELCWEIDIQMQYQYF